MSYTPGQWETRRNLAWSKDIDVCQINKFQTLAFVSSLNEDDARLIAAAPELLEACRMVTMLDKIGGMLPGVREMIDMVIKHAKAAIAKAEGEVQG